MDDFVERCRREWRRLGVPDRVAGEMAADLQADLDQAAAEGLAAEELLGSGVFDPPGFAAAWASERGVIPEPPRRPGDRRRLAVVGLVAFLLLAALGGALSLLAFHGATLVGTVHGAPAHLSGPMPHDFVRHVGPPAAGLRPLALALVGVGLAGVALSAVAWRRSSSSQTGIPRPGF